MKPISLTLKGFKGIKAGMGLDEIKVDFEALNGIIVFSAPNGSGKTTILDSLHPYRLMPYRAGNSYRPTAFTYYDHTYGDAEKIFVFEVDGKVYMSKILIDTDRKKAEAFLYVLDEETRDFVKYPGIDGKLDPYDRAVEEVLGSPELYFTSIFRAQNAKALSDYSKGDIKDLFVELLNISHLQAIGERARRIKQDLSGKVEILMAERIRLRDIVAKEAGTGEAIETARADISTIATEIESYEQEIITLQEQINKIDVKINLQMKNKAEADKIMAELHEKEKKYKTLSDNAETKGLGLSEKAAMLQQNIKTTGDLADRLPYLRSLSDQKSNKTETLEAIKADIAGIDDALAVMNTTLNEILTLDNQIKDKQNELATRKQKRQNELASSKKQLEDANKHAEYIKNSNCPIDNPTCNLMKAAVAKRDQIDNIQCDIEFHNMPSMFEKELQKDIDALTAKRTDPTTIRGQIAAVTDTKAELTAQQRALEREIEEITRGLERLPLAEQAEKQLPELRAQLEVIEAEIKTYAEEINKELIALSTDIEDLTLKVEDTTDPADHAGTRQDLIEKQVYYRTEIEDARAREARYRQDLGALEETLKQVIKAGVDLETTNCRITYLNGEISQWATLEKAFGNDGIIALELDDAGPQITTLANELLQVFGGRFSVRIDTQSAKAAGGMKEVFDITVFDNETNEQKSIKRLSGGEKTWIEDAVTKAICIYNKTASGRQFKSIFTDEKDGALDAEKKKEFFAMKRKVLELGGYDREFAITQSPELMAMADAVIKLSKEQGIEITIQ